MSYPNNPEVITSVEIIDSDGESKPIGDRIAGIQVRIDAQYPDGILDLDVREFDPKHGNLVLRLSLPEFVAALSRATLRADDNLD